MDMREGIMGHMAVGLNHIKSWRGTIELDATDDWIDLIGEVVLMDFILGPFSRDIIVSTSIILI